MEMEKDFIENFQKLEACIIIDGCSRPKTEGYMVYQKMGWTDLISDRNLKKMRTNNGKIDDPKDHELRFYWKDSIDVYIFTLYCSWIT